MKTQNVGNPVRKIVAIAVAIVVFAVVTVGIVLLDSPAQERLRRLDDRRVSDLRELSYAVDIYWSREGRLPSSWEEVADSEPIVRELLDPETGDPYEYRMVDEETYELCATFSRETVTSDRFPFSRERWVHGVGRECFQLAPETLEFAPEGR